MTVGMMTTGYDCEDLLNIVLLRPIFSPTDFVQIKGRGTRTFTFRYKERGRLRVLRGEVQLLPPLDIQRQIVVELDGHRKKIEEHKQGISDLETQIQKRIEDIWNES